VGSHDLPRAVERRVPAWRPHMENEGDDLRSAVRNARAAELGDSPGTRRPRRRGGASPRGPRTGAVVQHAGDGAGDRTTLLATSRSVTDTITSQDLPHRLTG
jgi:hypothetical protein